MTAAAAIAIHDAPTRPHAAGTEYYDEVGRSREYEDAGLAGLINRIERGTGWDIDGDGKIGETGDLKPTALESARAKLRPAVDLSRWVLEARVNRLQGPGFVEQRMIITEDILAFGESPDFDDVIALEDIARCGDVSELANASTSLLWNQGGTLPPHLFPLYLALSMSHETQVTWISKPQLPDA